MKNKLKQLLWNKYVLWGLIDLVITAAILAYVWYAVLDAGTQVGFSVS